MSARTKIEYSEFCRFKSSIISHFLMFYIHVQILQVSVDEFYKLEKCRFVVSVTLNPLGKRKSYIFSWKNLGSINHSFSFEADKNMANYLSLSVRRKSMLPNDPMIGYNVIDLSNLSRNEDLHFTNNLIRKEPLENHGEIEFLVHITEDNHCKPFKKNKMPHMIHNS